jgi:glutathione S-transferase
MGRETDKIEVVYKRGDCRRTSEEMCIQLMKKVFPTTFTKKKNTFYPWLVTFSLSHTLRSSHSKGIIMTQLQRYTLYSIVGSQPSLSVRLLFATYLPQVPYGLLQMQLGKEHREPWYSAMNPYGTVPMLVDHSKADLKLTESGAILHYLAKEHGLGQLLGQVTPPPQSQFKGDRQWDNAAGAKALEALFHHESLTRAVHVQLIRPVRRGISFLGIPPTEARELARPAIPMARETFAFLSDHVIGDNSSAPRFAAVLLGGGGGQVANAQLSLADLLISVELEKLRRCLPILFPEIPSPLSLDHFPRVSKYLDDVKAHLPAFASVVDPDFDQVVAEIGGSAPRVS